MAYCVMLHVNASVSADILTRAFNLSGADDRGGSTDTGMVSYVYVAL